MDIGLAPDPGTLLLAFRNAEVSAPRLRVGIVTDQAPVPWVESLVSFLQQVPVLDVQLLQSPSSSREVQGGAPRLTRRLYAKSQANFDPFGDVFTHAATTVPLTMLRDADCGVLIWLAQVPAEELNLQELARHGVFTVRLGDGDQTIPLWSEVAADRDTSMTSIFWHGTSLLEGRLVRQAETSTAKGLLVTENAKQPLVAAMRLLASLCLEIQSNWLGFEERVRQLSLEPTRALSLKTPSDLQAASFVARKLLRSARLRYTAGGKSTRWFIAMRPNRGGSVIDSKSVDLSGFIEVPLPRGVEAFADPFLWETGGKQFLLFEELAVGQSRGRLGCVEILAEGGFSDMQIILDRPYHLSYPCMVMENGEEFLLPETSEANRVELYRRSGAGWEFQLVSCPLEGIALVDTTPVLVDGRWYFFTTTIEPFMETVLFWAERLEGPWKLHPSSPISTSVRNCRSAGHLFWRDGRLFRPTQDCSVRYGYAMVVNEVTKLTPTEFAEREVSHLPPTWSRGLLGTHTWNETARFQVIDGIRYV